MIKRLFNVLKAYANYGSGLPKSSEGVNQEDFNSNQDFKWDQTSSSNRSGLNQQLIDDLAVFGLTPPSSFDEVKKARNREMRKYHPDKFSTQADKGETANEIAQIYNEAFGRLKDHFEK